MSLHPAARIEAEAVDDLPLTDPDEHIDYDLDPSTVNNVRARFAAEGLLAYATRTGINGEEPATALKDLLGDLRHLCDALGLDFAAIDDSAYSAYQEELGGIS